GQERSGCRQDMDGKGTDFRVGYASVVEELHCLVLSIPWGFFRPRLAVCPLVRSLPVICIDCPPSPAKFRLAAAALRPCADSSHGNCLFADLLLADKSVANAVGNARVIRKVRDERVRYRRR